MGLNSIFKITTYSIYRNVFEIDYGIPSGSYFEQEHFLGSNIHMTKQTPKEIISYMGLINDKDWWGDTDHGFDTYKTFNPDWDEYPIQTST